jgi:hypothetical protein
MNSWWAASTMAARVSSPFWVVAAIMLTPYNMNERSFFIIDD